MTGRDGGTYFCPVCGKPFDRGDKLSDFAFAAHEKDHAPERNNPANMIRYDEYSLMWVCKICGGPMHIGEYSARQAVVGHCREVHGSVTASSSPVTAGGGRRGRSDRDPGGVVDTVLDVVGEGLGMAGDAIGGAIGKALDFLGNMLDD